MLLGGSWCADLDGGDPLVCLYIYMYVYILENIYIHIYIYLFVYICT
jgi:hypothetical protein